MPKARQKSFAALIVAAGRGQRLGGATPKQYLPLAGIAVLRHALEVFLAHPALEGLQVVINEDDRALYEAAVAGLTLPPPVTGGATRQASVRNGLEALAKTAPAQVLIHDAARPFVTSALIDALLAALDKAPGAVPALAVTDTLTRGTDDRMGESVKREGLFAVQTPQAFHFPVIFAAHQVARGKSGSDDASDDASLLRAAGHDVALVAGSADNIKITRPEDLKRAEQIVAKTNTAETRVGQGFDVHALEPGTAITLCGVKLAHDRQLKGHSDADVALHAVTDALLGAISAGDIGSHFPPSDAKWKGAASEVFVKEALRLVRQAGGRLVHLDLTLICEAPKIGPHREALRQSLAEILETEPARVSIKATTTEGLGFTGRGEGIAAQALATLSLSGTAKP